ncbi:MAG: hypothetical protein WBB36_17940, partial [Chitinophagales bacterium]
TMDGGFVIAGETKSCEGNFSSNHGFSDGLIAKVDSHGKLLWTKLFGSPGNDQFNAVFENADGSLVAAGTVACHENDKKGVADFWLLKINADQTVLWSRHLGGDANDRLIGAMKSNNGYMLCGNTISSKGNAAAGYYRKTNGLIISTNAEGNVLWKKTIGGSNDDVITACSLTIDQGCLIGAITDSNDGMLYSFKQSSNIDCWLLKISAIGVMEWQTVVFDEGQGLVANTVLETIDGGYFLGGTASQRSVMMKFFQNRLMDWALLGDRKKETGKAFVEMPDSSFIMAAAGFTSDNYIRNNGFEDFYMVKMKPVNDNSYK